MTRIVWKLVHLITAPILAVVLAAAWLATSNWMQLGEQASMVGLAIVAAVSVVYWLTRPSEWQLRHLMAEDDIIVVPLRDPALPWMKVGDRYQDPDGTPEAVEFQKDRSMCVLGESGAGKTKAIEVLAHQMENAQDSEDEPFVAYDYKQDYQQFFDDTIRLSSAGSDVSWNVFLEMRDEEDATEIAAAVFSTSENNYFVNSAEQIFADVLRMMFREGVNDGYQPTNKDLLDYLKTQDADSLREDLEDGQFSSAKHLPKGAEAAKNIMSNLEMQVTGTFVGDFAREGDFSIRDYMNDPQGRKLILDFPIDKDESVRPIFRFFIDWSIRFGMLDHRGAYFILDEFAGLPQLSMLERLVNAGREYNCYCIVGVQSVSQMRKTYGRDEADSLLSGMAQEIHLRVGEDSVDYWRRRLGKTRTEHLDDETGVVDRVTEDHRIGESEVQNLEPGQAVVHTTSGWQRGRLYMLSEVIGDLLPREQSVFRRAVEQSRSALPSASDDDDPQIEETDRKALPDDD